MKAAIQQRPLTVWPFQGTREVGSLFYDPGPASKSESWSKTPLEKTSPDLKLNMTV